MFESFLLENCRIYKRRYEIDKTKESYSDLFKQKKIGSEFFLCSRHYFILQDTMTCCWQLYYLTRFRTSSESILAVKEFLTSLTLQNIAMSKTEFPFEKLASVWLRVNFFYVPSQLLLSFVVFVVAPLWVRREVLEWIQEWKSKFFRNQIGHYFYFDKFKNGWRFLPRTLAKKINSQGNTLEIGYISCIPEIPNKILPALFFPFFLYFLIIFFIYNAQFVSFVVVE